MICPSVRKRLKRDSIIILKTNTSVLDQESKGVKQSCLIILCLILHFDVSSAYTLQLSNKQAGWNKQAGGSFLIYEKQIR